MRDGRGLLVDQTGQLDARPWSDRVNVIVDHSPDLDTDAVLLRPDGHVIHAGGGQEELNSALRQWFGQPLS